MEVVIVGHGPSLVDSNKGQEIDKRAVVRLKKCDTVISNGKDYGIRCDYMCSSTEVMGGMLDMSFTPKEYWGYPKKGSWTQSNEKKMDGNNYIIFLDECEKWNVLFRKYAGEPYRNYSTGLAAIIIACFHLKPEKIYLAGFDTVLDPKKKYVSRYNKNPIDSHRWDVENKMLPLIEGEYGLEIDAL